MTDDRNMTDDGLQMTDTYPDKNILLSSNFHKKSGEICLL